MTEILPGVHTIDGINPSPDFTTHVYLVREKSGEWTLIDSGLPGSDKAILAELGRLGGNPKQIRNILVTHLHNDHTGSLVRLKAETGAKIHAHWLEAAFIAAHPKYDGPGVPPAHPIQVDAMLKDGDRLDLMGGVVAYHTPGHTPGHTSYYLPERRILFSGDLFFGMPEMALTVPDYTHHTLSAQVSARRVSELSIESVLSYHGGPFPKGAGAQLKALVAKF
jgi:glyoxylase-like metal-dependent hydrolase (beta-lactamase superfamily II)